MRRTILSAAAPACLLVAMTPVAASADVAPASEATATAARLSDQVAISQTHTRADDTKGDAQAAVFENGPELILDGGLPYDRCHVGVVTDFDGFEKLKRHDVSESDQLYKVLRTQIDVVLDDGVGVLNAASMAQCCGLQFEFQRYNYPSSYVIPADRRFNFSFVLAGLGTFSNFFGAFGGGR